MDGISVYFLLKLYKTKIYSAISRTKKFESIFCGTLGFLSKQHYLLFIAICANFPDFRNQIAKLPLVPFFEQHFSNHRMYKFHQKIVFINFVETCGKHVFHQIVA